MEIQNFDPARYMKLMDKYDMVYICSAYKDNPRVNVMRARRYCRFAVGKGVLPIAPHLYFPQFMEEKYERGRALEMNLMLLRRCKEIWVFGRHISEGMAWEMEQAERLGIPARRFSTQCEEEEP